MPAHSNADHQGDFVKRMKSGVASALAPALSPRRGRAHRRCRKMSPSQLQSPPHWRSFQSAPQYPARQHRPRTANDAPSPGGEGRGEGEAASNFPSRNNAILFQRKCAQAHRSEDQTWLSPLAPRSYFGDSNRRIQNSFAPLRLCVFALKLPRGNESLRLGAESNDHQFFTLKVTVGSHQPNFSPFHLFNHRDS